MVSCLLAARAAWPQVAMFRGTAAHAGVFAGANGLSLGGLQWRFETAGDVISSPVISGATVYIGSNDGRLYALALATGAVKWVFDAGSPIPTSPAVSSGAVFFGARDGTYYSVDQATGQRRWSFKTGSELPWPWGHESGDHYLSSPSLDAGAVIFGAGDGNVYALDAATGKERWHVHTEGRVRSSPAIDRGRIFVGSADGVLYALDAATGATAWRYRTEGASLSSKDYGFDRRTIQSSPAVADGIVFVGARDGFLYAVDAATGKLRWRADNKVSWVNASPAIADGVVYSATSDGHFVQAIDASSGNELWRAPTDVPAWSSPSIAGTMLYGADWAGRIHALDRKTGKEAWFFRTGAAVFSSPAISGDLLVVGSTDGSVYALRLSDRAPIQRAVFFDSAYLKAGRNTKALELAQYLSRRGYEIVDAPALTAFLRARTADRAPSVVVFAIDHLPPAADSGSDGKPLLRRYLDAAGKVVWTGILPKLWPADPSTGKAGGLGAIDWGAGDRLLGVPFRAAIFDQRGIRRTSSGARWGLPARWREAWGVDPSGVTEVLGLDDWGLAAAWVKSYGGEPGTGFVRVPADDMITVYLAAEYRPVLAR
ncbi:MAG TPA: PQQ-binding-like beta-propeller repeat protein [Gemmatimonadaceae bacterium]|nr:PQQ-binding-like beta-propeller repeat protein [Gemmatimonadaceae bacterium]